MPYMGGREATQVIRQYERHHNLDPVPIIALTAHASTSPPFPILPSPHLTYLVSLVIGDKERSLQCGMDDHITKPLRRNDLINTIGKLGAERKAHLMRSRWLHRAPVFR